MTLKRLAIIGAVLVLALAACGGGSDSSGDSGGGGAVEVEAGDPVSGSTVYKSTCSACHGADLQGVDGLGKGLAPNEFVAANSEEELAAFINIGRPAGDPANMTGVDMPPRGGNPSLTDQDIRDVSAYLKAQQ